MTEYYRIINTENVQFLVTKATDKTRRCVHIDYHFKEMPYFVAYECKDWDEQDSWFHQIDEEVCMGVYNATLASLN